MELDKLKGLGDKTKNLLEKNDIHTVEDLLNYYPYRYQVLKPVILDETTENITIAVNATVSELPKVNYLKRNLNILRFKAICYGKIIFVTIFNRAYLKSHLSIGKEITLLGKYNPLKSTFTASDIKLSKLEGTTINPVYHMIKGITHKQLENLIESSLAYRSPEEPLPFSLVDKYHFMSHQDAIRFIHNPYTLEELKSSRLRLIYEELFTFMFKIEYLKSLETKEVGVSKKIDSDKIKKFISTLPFQLTSDQLFAVKEGLKDMSSRKKMNRLLIGDVGSGKTMVAIILMYASFLAGYQSVFLAPTEILAVQHYETIEKIFQNMSISVSLLVGSMTNKKKAQVMKENGLHKVDILIGTHAVLNSCLTFANLGLVITDEQHRFGVNQREFLGKNTNCPDMLFMSATPIPRTYALTIYADMDTSLLKEKPLGRKEIITKVVKEKDLKRVLTKVLEEIKNGHQVYVVAPEINEEESDLKNINLLKEKFELAFHSLIPIGLIHGKLKKQEKEAIMSDFKKGKTKILIATTIIEVGVDIKDATVMMIFNAECFGLATLHQLRGRVGRNDMQSYCYLISNYEIDRLKVLEESNDGFYISQKDFEFRGEGDLFGKKQSGDMSFKIADLKRDYKILLKAKEDVKTFITTKDYLKYNNYTKIVKEIEFTN